MNTSDIWGTAILDYLNGNKAASIITETCVTDADELKVSHLFRNFDEMPELEQKALQLCKGSTLDIGCGVGSHSLCLKSKGLTVFPIDISAGAIEACHLRGLTEARVVDLHQLKDEKFDTVLLLMNGIGLAGTLAKTSSFISHLKSLLTTNGQIILDSSDIRYLYDTDEDGGLWIPADKEYYGDLLFTVSYQNKKQKPFPWVYVDFENLKIICENLDLNCQKVYDGPHFDFLVKITPKKQIPT
ncbi:MAG: class I SAM-dependent methyltransferase [Flavobacterium sp.]